jgi:hypothetical protein
MAMRGLAGDSLISTNARDSIEGRCESQSGVRAMNRAAAFMKIL